MASKVDCVAGKVLLLICDSRALAEADDAAGAWHPVLGPVFAQQLVAFNLLPIPTSGILAPVNGTTKQAI